MRLLIVLGEGGHSKEMLALVDLLGDHLYVTENRSIPIEYAYLLTKEDVLSQDKIRWPGPLYRVIRPRSKNDPAWLAAGKVFLCLWQSLSVILRTWPEAIISSGPAVAIPISFWGKVFRKAVIFIETGSRVRRLSLTGRLMRHLADLFFVQWPQIGEEYPQAIYAGRLF